ncbi:MAG TPA: aminopeptidase [Ktedonobacterales bacterium]
MSDFDTQLDNYMEIILRVGLNLQPGQTLRIGAGGGVALDHAAQVRQLARKAYDLGAGNVQVTWRDLETQRMWFERASAQALESFSSAQVQVEQELIDQHAAMASLAGADPDAFATVDAARMGVAMKAQGIAMRPVSAQIMAGRVPWVVAAMASPGWAHKVFPDKTPDEALSALWAYIFHAVRADTPDPIAAWRTHVDQLSTRVAALDRHHFAGLRYRGPGTDLTIVLPAKHRWIGGGGKDSRGIPFVPNIPTEEVFSLPQRDGVYGTVRGTMPVLLRGTVVDGIAMRFEAGRVVEYAATQGQEALKGLIETDEGSRYLGEVALVTDDSPTFATFPLYSTLFDENVTCHIALGKAYAACLQDGDLMSVEQLAAEGANDSAAHWDFMIGSPELEIDGETADGQLVPIIRNGAWRLG